MYSALVGHDIESLYLSSSLCLFLSPSLILASLSISLLSTLFSLFFLALFFPTLSFSLSACLALVHSLSGLFPPLAWHQFAAPLQTSVCTEKQTGKRCLMIRLEMARSEAVFILFLLFSPPSVYVSVCLLIRFNSLAPLLSGIIRKSKRDVDRHIQTHR